MKLLERVLLFCDGVWALVQALGLYIRGHLKIAFARVLRRLIA